MSENPFKKIDNGDVVETVFQIVWNIKNLLETNREIEAKALCESIMDKISKNAPNSKRV